MKLASIQVNTHFRLFLRLLFHIFDTLVVAVIFCFMKPEFRFEKTRDPNAFKKTVKLAVQVYRMSFRMAVTPQTKLKYVLNFSKCVLFAGEIVNLRIVLNVYMILRLTFACREEKDESRGDVEHSRTRAEKRGIQNLQTMYLKTKLLLHGSKKIRRPSDH